MSPTRKKILFVVLATCFVASVGTAVSFAAAPQMLGVESVLCPDAGRFVVHEGPTELRPDGQAAAPIAWRCAQEDGAETEPHVMAGLAVHFVAWALLAASLLGTWVARLR